MKHKIVEFITSDFVYPFYYIFVALVVSGVVILIVAGIRNYAPD